VSNHHRRALTPEEAGEPEKGSNIRDRSYRLRNSHRLEPHPSPLSCLPTLAPLRTNQELLRPLFRKRTKMGDEKLPRRKPKSKKMDDTHTSKG
jgi:hypothetical protein